MEEIEGDYVNYARQLSSSGNLSKSFDIYISVFEKNPRLKNMYEPEFQIVMMRYNETLSAAGKIEDIFTNFSRAIKIFPKNVYLLNEIGKYLYKFGYYEEAWSHFQKALSANSGFVNAEKNLNSVKNLLVERWHFRMLNDKKRNELFRAAIHEIVKFGKDNVIDVGTGTGLLALFARKCQPLTITACDGSSVMTKIAENIIQDYEINDIAIVNKMSTAMDYKEIGSKCTVLVTEMFDAGLFGEHVLQTLLHAWNYLIDVGGKVIPGRAEFFVAGVNCNYLNLKYQLGQGIKTLLNIPTANVHMMSNDETYDCEDVHSFKDLKYMTEEHSLIKIDFNNYDDIQDKLYRSEPFNIDLIATQDGEINCMIGWFNLYLTDNVTITTDPRSEDRCNAWQQAVFFDIIPKEVKKNDSYTTQFLMNTGKLTMVPNYNINIDKISHEALRFLNDSEYVKTILGCVGMACVYLGQIIEMAEIVVIDLCPFPLFGLQMLKRGAKSLVCTARTYNDEIFILKVLEANKIDISKITILVGDLWNLDSFVDTLFHAIFCHPFELCGEIDLRLKDIAHELKTSHLAPGGLYMPATISIIGQLVDSHWLDINNRVYDENTIDYKVSGYMNVYQVSQNFCIDMSRLEYTPMSRPTCLGECSNELRSFVINVPIIKDGTANAILCWYKIELMEDIGEIATNRSDGFVDSIAFLADPKVPMKKGDIANVLRCVDPDGGFKLLVDIEN
ncbi:protein arginine N-methyltransferase 9 [Papilio machaon]|uniref:protein arginine N-methyltransferase 9 n=1 Tax=Papilio machaon TaxID=76193 RepID=UPI001E664880|nr:protein arginine N-methyltransferase 9 [Papilio machaon]